MLRVRFECDKESFLFGRVFVYGRHAPVRFWEETILFHARFLLSAGLPNWLEKMQKFSIDLSVALCPFLDSHMRIQNQVLPPLFAGGETLSPSYFFVHQTPIKVKKKIPHQSISRDCACPLETATLLLLSFSFDEEPR